MTTSTPENQYLFNGIEHEGDFGLDWDMTDFRTYDPAIGRWGQIDPLAEVSPEWTPYRFGFNNPILYSDPEGLFETKDDAKEYAKKNGIKTGVFRRNKVKKQGDGTYAIENKKKGTSVSDLGDEIGVVTSIDVVADDVMSSTFDRSHGSAGALVEQLRDGSQRVLPVQSGTVSAGGPGVNLNSLKATSNFVNYVFRNGKEILKVGKAHGGRITKSTGLPTRVHQQYIKLIKKYPNLKLSINNLGEVTSKRAIQMEKAILKKIYKKLGYVPKGNVKSFKPRKNK